MSTLALIPPLRYEAYSYLSDVSDFAHLTQVSAGQKRDMQSFLNLIWRKFARMKNASETFPYMFEVYRECQGNMTLAKIRELYNGILHLETLRLRGMQSDEEFTHLKQQHLPKSLGANPEFYMPIENERWRHLPISIADQFSCHDAHDFGARAIELSRQPDPEPFLKWVENEYPDEFMLIHTKKVLMPAFFAMKANKVTKLRISQCELVSIPKHAFQNFPYLVELILGYNNLRSLPSGLFFNNPHLKKLYLNGNPLDDSPLPEVPDGCVIETGRPEGRKSHCSKFTCIIS